MLVVSGLQEDIRPGIGTGGTEHDVVFGHGVRTRGTLRGRRGRGRPGGLAVPVRTGRRGQAGRRGARGHGRQVERHRAGRREGLAGQEEGEVAVGQPARYDGESGEELSSPVSGRGGGRRGRVVVYVPVRGRGSRQDADGGRREAARRDLDAEGLQHSGEGVAEAEVGRALLLLERRRCGDGGVHGGEAVGQVGQESLSQGGIDAFDAADVARDLGGAFVEAGFEFVEDGRVCGYGSCHLLSLNVLQVVDCHFKNVRLFQLRMPRGIFVQGI